MRYTRETSKNEDVEIGLDVRLSTNSIGEAGSRISLYEHKSWKGQVKIDSKGRVINRQSYRSNKDSMKSTTACKILAFASLEHIFGSRIIYSGEFHKHRTG